MTGWLASVMDVSEAQQVMDAGASIIDAKNPHEGALGALPLCTVRAIVDTVGRRVPVSATVGDFPRMEPHSVIHAVNAVGATGVDFVKIGLFPAPALIDCLEELAPLCRQFRIVAVLFADQNPDLQLVDRLAELGFAGVMLDTMDKSSGWLLRHQPVERLAHFVTQARNLNLISGLAGSLRAVDISVLRSLNPNYLGFRGALCHKHTRTQTIDLGALAAITKALATRSASGTL
ncbi:MAG: (5-formylfuran-3-yl)methyl phosphate synthase [Thiobacillus sp.]|nr:(5-formylfuran-3-yl)methyl phosphate synthase [Thiobacillus sp.]